MFMPLYRRKGGFMYRNLLQWPPYPPFPLPPQGMPAIRPFAPPLSSGGMAAENFSGGNPAQPAYGQGNPSLPNPVQGNPFSQPPVFPGVFPPVPGRPPGFSLLLNSFKNKDGTIDFQKMVNTAGQMVNTLNQVTGLIKGFSQIFKA